MVTLYRARTLVRLFANSTMYHCIADKHVSYSRTLSWFMHHFPPGSTKKTFLVSFRCGFIFLCGVCCVVCGVCLVGVWLTGLTLSSHRVLLNGRTVFGVFVSNGAIVHGSAHIYLVRRSSGLKYFMDENRWGLCPVCMCALAGAMHTRGHFNTQQTNQPRECRTYNIPTRLILS